MTRDVAEDVLGAAKDGSVKVFAVASLFSSSGTHAQHTHSAPRACPWETREGTRRARPLGPHCGRPFYRALRHGTGVMRRTSRPSRLLAGAGPAAPAGR